MFTRKDLRSLFSISLSYIDFVPHVYLKTKHNLYRYLNEHTLNAWLFVLHMFSIVLIFF